MRCSILRSAFFKQKILISFLSLFLLAGLLSGCLRENRPVNPSPKPHDQRAFTVAVYYVKATEKGGYLVREVHQIPPTPDPARAALQELISGKTTTPGAIRVLPPDTRILGVIVNNGLATVNFSREVLKANVGSEGEALGIQSIVNTLTEFPEIQRVSLQVEGKVDARTQDWWGHVGLYDQPFRRDLSQVFEPAIWVTHPNPGQVAGVPLLVKGSARVFEGSVNARLLDGHGRILAKATTTASQKAPERGDFELRLHFKPPETSKGKLEVYSINPRNGSEENKVSITVTWP